MSTDPNKFEELSALADGELGTDQARFLLRRCEADLQLATRWQHYHLIRASLRRESAAVVHTGFAIAVAARLATEARPSRRSSWSNAALGGAIAAGVAALALLTIAPPAADPMQMPTLVSTERVRTDDLTSRLPATQVSDRVWAPLSVSAPFDPRLEGYFLRHSSAANG